MTSWKLIEDVTLCESWVHSTHDPIMGNEMDKREMWSKITGNEIVCANSFFVIARPEFVHIVFLEFIKGHVYP